MKLAVTGKGGVGKSTLAAALAMLMARRGRRVLAVDADPDANLASCLGIDAAGQREIVPISARRALIEERTGARVREYGQIFKLNPEVSDIADTLAYLYEGVALLVLGAIEGGGSGCACPENVLLRALVTDLVLRRDEALVMDMEAGVEHLGRSTARGVDTMVVVVEPGQRAVDSARRITEMAHDIGIGAGKVRYLANKLTGPEDEAFVRNAFPDRDLIGCIPYSEEFRRGDREGRSVLDGLGEEMVGLFEKILRELDGERTGDQG